MPNRARRYPGTCTRSMPSSWITPLVMGRSPIILLSVVVLPVPLRPTRAISPPAGISKLIPRKILKPLIVTQIPSTYSMATPAPVPLYALQDMLAHWQGAVSDHLSVIEHQAALTVSLHNVHIVFHKNRRDSALLKDGNERIHYQRGGHPRRLPGSPCHRWRSR